MFRKKDNFVRGAIVLAFVLVISVFVLYQQSPPRPVGPNAAANVFSSGRAMESLRIIAQRPHPIGSPEHEAVKNFLLHQLNALGLQTEVQTTSTRGVAVNNVIAILKGSNPTRAVLLAAHYDTVANSPGASDDGAGVATLLETARALKNGPPLQNDVIFLFSDGEETGLLGAQAFVYQHPLARQVALALNFEARGASGPSMLFETSDNNAWLIDQFASSVPYPNGNSVAYEIYRRMPNSTDMHVFKDAGMAGLNFAYFDGVDRYHSSADDLQNISEASLQHHGTYALALAQHFGNVSLDTPGTGNAVYFDLFGRWLVHYSTKWVLPSTFVLTVLFIAVTWFGRKRVEKLTMGVLVCWLVLLVITSLLLPASSYLFFWPLLFCLAARLIMFSVKTTTPQLLALQLLLALPAIVLFVPLIYNIYVALGSPAVIVIIPLLLLLFGLLISQFVFVTPRKAF